MRLTLRYYENVKDYLHPHIRQFIHHYRFGDIIDLPLYHGCNRVNKNGTRKQICYSIGEQCTHPTDKRYWKKTKNKYKIYPDSRYFSWTRYNTQTNCRYLFKNRGNLVYNYKLKRYQHMSDTPMRWEFYHLESIRKGLFKNAL